MKRILKYATVTLFMILTSFMPVASKEKAPSFALIDTNGKYVTLNDLLNKNLLLAFWASYCKPCKREIPQLIELEKKYSIIKNVRLVLINIDTEGKDAAMPLLNELLTTPPCLFDRYQIVVKKYSPDLKIPATFLINKNGEVLFKIIGESDENIKKIEQALQKL